MRRTIPTGFIAGDIAAPPSKSYSHRRLIISALAGGGRVLRPLDADDVQVTLSALKSLSYDFEREADSIVFHGRNSAPVSPNLDAGESGTSARFLTALAALESTEIRLSGSGRMHKRPFKPLLDVLRQLGVACTSKDGFPPLQIRGPLRQGGRVVVSAAQSSQFVSALMLVAPLLRDGLQLSLEGPVRSRPYIEITAVCMREAGIDVRLSEREIQVSPGKYIPRDYVVEGDWSNAAYWLIGAAIGGSSLRVSNLRSDSVQGDRALVDILRGCGVDLTWQSKPKHEFLVLHRSGRLKSFSADIESTPDLAPSLAVLALFCEGRSELHNVAILRHKESDRLAALVHNLQQLGATAESDGRTLHITPPPQIQPAQLRTFGDHRIAMSFAMAGLRTAGIELDDASVVSKSYPHFWRDFEQVHHAAEAV